MIRKAWMRPRFPSEIVPWKLRTLGVLIAVVLAVYMAAIWVALADDQWGDSPYHGWADKQQVMPAAKARFGCDPNGSYCSCCNGAEIVRTKFRPTSRLNAQGYQEDGWEWLNPTSNKWEEVAQDIIHWDEPTPDGQAVIFIFPPQGGAPRCFFPPNGGGG